VLLLKYQDRRALALDLGALMAKVLQERIEEWQPDGLVPVPIHRMRRRERGYNQSELLARAVGERSDLQVREALIKVKDTRPLARLSLQERRKEVHDSIRPRQDVGPGRRPVLIDDVQTSGATLEECARALRQAGAQTVYALTVCWQPPAGGTRQQTAAHRDDEPLPL
jgi:ComF family protein